MAYLRDSEILQYKSYIELGKAVSRGEISLNRLRSYYSGARKTAMSRTRRVSKTTEFGTQPKEEFAKACELKTARDLIREVADVNKYLNAKRSTISGLKTQRTQRLEKLQEHGFDWVDQSNYASFVDFMKWFKSSEFAKKYDSESQIVKDVFQNAENATPEDWRALFLEYIAGESSDEDNTVQEY